MSARSALLAGAIALVSVQAAAATRPACVSPGDARTLFAVALPDAIEGLAKRCRAVLPADSYLPSRGAALADRYRHEAPVDPARARRAIQAASGQDLSFLADDATVTTLAHGFVEKMIAERVATRDCPTIDGLVALAAPMRADAMAEALLLGLQIAGPDVTPGVSICRGDEVAGQ